MKLPVRACATALLAAAPAQALAAPAQAPQQLTIVLGGDTGLNGSFQPVNAGFGIKQGERLSWSGATNSIAPLLDGDVNFVNLETVVTDRNDLKPSPKLFGFRTHPEGVRELLQAGVNLFSTANNHAMDYGLDGARETLKHLAAMNAAHAGLGLNRTAAAAPRLVSARGHTLALGAVGIAGGGYGAPQPGEERPGHLTFAGRDLPDAVDALAAARADYRMLSVHYGREFEVATAPEDRRRLLAALDSGADLVIGHHQHVAAGIEFVRGKAVFYGLGNFLHWGTQDMGRFDICRDYGLLARLHLSAQAGERLSLKAVEAVPLGQMHKATRALSEVEAHKRIHVLNHLATKLGPSGMRFAHANGTGLWCGPGAETLSGRIGERCRAKPEEETPEPALAREIATACARTVLRIVEVDGLQEPEFATLSHEVPAAE